MKSKQQIKKRIKKWEERMKGYSYPVKTQYRRIIKELLWVLGE